jgi:hypothetical protein
VGIDGTVPEMQQWIQTDEVINHKEFLNNERDQVSAVVRIIYAIMLECVTEDYGANWQWD